MCRSIKQLRVAGQPTTREEIRAAARQYVRKVSGFHRPSQANTPAYETAIDEVAQATERLLATLVVRVLAKSDAGEGRPH
jgi:hypothetical protein